MTAIKTKKSDSYKTPEWILNMFGDWFDPCPYNENPIVDGLNIEWQHKTFINPPYSNIIGWVEKAISENNKGKQIVLLLPLDCTTKWYRRLIEERAIIMFIGSRCVKFEGKNIARGHIFAILLKDEI
tara:strand:+ start:346 stop:726 length:381 start_codon:yes stop_codon:yes gene_type:complete